MKFISPRNFATNSLAVLFVKAVRRPSSTESAAIHQRQSIAHHHGFDLIMGHIERVDTKRPGVFLIFDPATGSSFAVKRWKALIQSAAQRFKSQRPCQRNTACAGRRNIAKWGAQIGLPLHRLSGI